MKAETPTRAANSGTGELSAVDIIHRILNQGEGAMNQRYQDPKILKRSDVKRPFYYVLASVPVVTAKGLKRKRQSFFLGFCDETTLGKAKAQKQQILAPINAGKSIIQSQIRFGDLAEKFEDARIPQLGSATQAKYRTLLRNHVVPTFGDIMLCDITRPAIEAWINQKAQPSTGSEGLSWSTRTDLRNLLSAVFTKAAEWNLWDGRNPCEGVEVGRKKMARAKRIPAPDDFRKFLEAIPDTAIISADGARLIVITAAVAGLRVSEVLGLHSADIDHMGETLRVERRWYRGDIDEPKSESSKRTRQIGSLAAELLAWAGSKGPDDFIFQREDGNPPDDRDLQQHVWRPAAEAAGIYDTGFGMHTFRRLNVTWRQHAGATPIEAQKAAGHASLDMTFLYTQNDEAREREHVAQIMDRIKSAPNLAAMTPEGKVS